MAAENIRLIIFSECTSNLYKFLINRNAQYKIYVENKINELGRITTDFSKPIKEVFCLEWSLEIVDGVEVVYGMFEKKAFNEGKATLAEIATWFSMGTDLKFKDLYGAFGEIKKRKENVPRFLNGLSKSLDERVERDNKKKRQSIQLNISNTRFFIKKKSHTKYTQLGCFLFRTLFYLRPNCKNLE